MPTYDYLCERCGHEFEEFQAITARPLKKCPACGQRTLQRLIGTGGGIIFKGSGFYQTDYRSESYKQGAEAENKATSTSKDDKNGKDTNAEKTAGAEKTAEKSSEKPAAKAEGSSPSKAASKRNQRKAV